MFKQDWWFWKYPSSILVPKKYSCTLLPNKFHTSSVWKKKHNNWYSADTWSMAWLPLSWHSINCWLIVGGVEWLMYWSTLDWMSTKISQLRCQSRVLIEVIDQYLTLKALRTHDSKHFPILSYLTSLVCTTINTKWAVHKARHKSDLVCHSTK